MKKVLTTILILLLAASLVGCGKKDKKKTADSVEGDISIADESGLEKYEDTGSDTDDEEEEEPVSEISQEDADILIQEKLAGKNCEPIYSDTSYIDDENYYTYTVLDASGEEMAQMLAVNAVSGEVYVYDIDSNTVFDFSRFELYNSESDEPVSWEGSFKSGKMTLALEPGGEDYFEFTFSGGKELTGVADAEGRIAEYEDDNIALEFISGSGTIEVKDRGAESGFAGTYSKRNK